MRKDLEPTTMQTTKEIVNGIWTVGRDIYKGAKEEMSNAIDEETLLRVREELNLKFDDKVNLDDPKTLESYEHQKKLIKKEARTIGLKGGLIIFGLGWLF